MRVGVTERVSFAWLSQLLSCLLIWNSVAVVPDGYGLSYAIGDDYIRWTITSLKRDTQVLKHYLAEAATEVKHMLEAAEKKEHAKDKGKL